MGSPRRPPIRHPEKSHDRAEPYSPAVLCCPCSVRPSSADEPRWKQHAINARNEFEAAASSTSTTTASSISSRATPGTRLPTGSPFTVRDVKRVGTYFNDFSTLPLDFNGDGYTDFITCSYFGRNVGWVENPGKPGAPWTYHEVDIRGTIEAAWMVDLSGDGVPDFLPNTVNVVVWYEVVKKGDGKGFDLKKHDFGVPAAGHGVGSGDVNGDGRTDLLTPKGWFEAPADPAHEPGPGTPTGRSARPVSRCSLVTSTAMGCRTWSMAWVTIMVCSGSAKQGPGGKPTWTKQTIDDSVASVHALIWADIDGDGKAHELVTGKRVYAHEVEPGATDGSLVAWYDFNPNSKSWVRHVIFQGEPAKSARRRTRDRRHSRTSRPERPAPASKSPPSTSTATATSTSSAPARAASISSRTCEASK